MTRRSACLAALLCAAFQAPTAFAVAPSSAQLEALEALRLDDPKAFLAQLRALDGRSAPADPRMRDQWALLGAQALALESRFAEALRQADYLAGSAAAADTRLRAAALAVNVQAARRDFVDGQKRLETLLGIVEHQPDRAVRRHVDLVAAVFYNQLSQSEIALRHAERVLASDAPAAERCNAAVQVVEARRTGPSPALRATDIDRMDALCATADRTLPARYADVLRARWWVAEGNAARAASHLRTRMPPLLATGEAPLIAEAHALFAEALRKTGQLDDAQAQAEAVLTLSSALPSGLPLLSARRTRYAIALERGDDRAALRELQAVLTAERAYEEEVRQLLIAHEAGRQDSMARQQALALLEQRNARLRLEARHSERMAMYFTLMLVPLGVAVVALLGWTWQSRRLRQRHRDRLRIDPLTTLWTRQHFSEQASAALAGAERKAQPMALVLLDLDHFSQVNSRHGHLSGDRLLAAVGRTLAGLQGPARHIGRLGGEEFAVLLAGAGLDEGLDFAERCRNAVAATRATTFDGGTALGITASFGVVSTAAAGYRLRDLLANADQALYRAKGAGRNRLAAAVMASHDDAEAAT